MQQQVVKKNDGMPARHWCRLDLSLRLVSILPIYNRKFVVGVKASVARWGGGVSVIT